MKFLLLLPLLWLLFSYCLSLYANKRGTTDYYSKEAYYRFKYLTYFSGWQRDFSLTYQTSAYDPSDRPINQIVISFVYGLFFFKWPRKINGKREREYGIKIHDRQVWIHYGKGYANYALPWYVGAAVYMYYLTSLTGDVWDKPASKNPAAWKQRNLYMETEEAYESHERSLYKEVHSYMYRSSKNDPIRVLAVVSVREGLWRINLLRWTSLFQKTRRFIDIEFAGNRVSCYKTSYEMLPFEYPFQALKRMEKERTF